MRSCRSQLWRGWPLAGAAQRERAALGGPFFRAMPQVAQWIDGRLPTGG